MVKHRYEDVVELAWDEPLGTFEERYRSVEVDGEDSETQERDAQETEPAQPLVLREIGQTIEEARGQLEALREALLGVSPAQAPEVGRIYQRLFRELSSYLDSLERQYST